MSIVALRKATLFGMAAEKETVLRQVQGLGILHLVPLCPAPAEPEKQPPDRPVEAYKALRYLSDVRDKRRAVHHDPDFDMQTVIAQVLHNQQQIRETEDRRDALRERVEALRPWGNFIHTPPAELGGQRLWFYVVPADGLQPLRELELPWQVVYRDNRFAYLVVLAEDEPAPGLMPVPRTHTGSRPLEEVLRLLEETEITLEDLQAERQALSRWIYLIASHLNAAEELAARNAAASQTLDDEALFALQGWVPEPELERLQAYATDKRLALLIEEPSETDQPPTLLSNPPRLAAGQDLVGFYQTPGYRSWDPSQVVFLSFTLFFAMILSDAGYAAILSGAVFAGWRSMGRSDTGRRLRVLAATLCGSAVVWGVLVGSYFGYAPSPESLAGQLKLLDINDFDTMMQLSVAVGMLHIVLANAFMAWQYWGHNRAWVSLGWIAVVASGGLIWFSTQEGASPMLGSVGQGLLGLGLLGIFLFGGERPLHRLGDLPLRLFGGLSALTNITKIFGDVLSYLRLFALGLASASLALTFNDLAQQVAEANPGMGLLFSLLILLAGHALNILLSLMSGVVHGLRLNFIEFYNWGLSEEGYPFRAFAKKGVKE